MMMIVWYCTYYHFKLKAILNVNYMVIYLIVIYYRGLTYTRRSLSFLIYLNRLNISDSALVSRAKN